VAQQLADGDVSLSVGSELRPVVGDAVVVLEQAGGTGVCHPGGRDPLRRGEHEHERVRRPRGGAAGVAVPAPEVDDDLPLVVRRDRGAEFARRAKFRSNASRTGSNPGATVPPMGGPLRLMAARSDAERERADVPGGPVSCTRVVRCVT
jgi:hypothetical protein